MRSALLVILFASGPVNGAEWAPPKNPDPQAILLEARGDTDAKRYETALAKHLWFHDQALSIRPAMYGVRLSFALANWHELAKSYPPALDKLEETRDQAAQKVTQGESLRESFHDMAAINRTLGEESLTKKVFATLDSQNPHAAKQVFGIAQPALIKAKAYKLFAKYVNPKVDFARITEIFQRGKRLAKDPRFGARHLQFAQSKFTNDAATLVAILAINQRQNEAKQIALAAKMEWNNESFHSQLDQSLAGKVPDPWP